MAADGNINYACFKHFVSGFSYEHFLLLFRKQLECIGRGRTNKNVLCGHTMLETHIYNSAQCH